MRLLLVIATATAIANALAQKIAHAAAKMAKTALANAIVQNVIADARTKKHANAKKTDLRFSKSLRKNQRAIVTATAIANKNVRRAKSPPQLKGKVMHADKKKVVRLLKTVQGQIQGLINMVEENRYCIDISTQILSSQSILKKVNYEILKGHFEHCIKDSVVQGDKAAQDEKIEELVGILDKILEK